MSTAPVITIFVRHAANCKYKGDEFEKRCLCRKHLRWSTNGTQFRRMAGTRSWAEAEEHKRDLEDQLAGRAPVSDRPNAHGIRESIDVFLTDKKVQGVTPGVIGKYTRELDRLRDYCERRNIFTVEGITRELLTGFCATWEAAYPSTYTRAKVRERCRSFLRYCYEAQWIPRVPSLPKIKIDEPPTLPLKRRGIHRIVTARQKTGTHVSVPIPPQVAQELLTVANDNPRYVFWSGNGTEESITKNWAKYYIAPAFAAAKIHGGHMMSHRLRDTFAVDLLVKGVSLEEVSKLLGHESIRTTEKHYAKWVKGRQDRLDNAVTGTWT